MLKIISTTVVFVTGGLFGGVAKAWYDNYNVLQADADTSIVNRHVLQSIPSFILPKGDDIKIYNNFILSYNRRTRNANWVMEVLTPDLVLMPTENPDFRKDLNFEIDETEHPMFRSTSADYSNSGFDRGHLAAAANYKNDETDCRRSFVMTNIVPQVGANFNRGIWNELEKFTRALVRRSEFVIVCSGPLYLPKSVGSRSVVEYEVIGRNNVAVPTHFFKVLLVKELNANRYKLFSYVLRNQPVTTTRDFDLFLVPLADIERAAGFFIFSNLLGKINFSQINKQHFT